MLSLALLISIIVTLDTNNAHIDTKIAIIEALRFPITNLDDRKITQKVPNIAV
jgi:hypothetical protein